MEKNTRDTRDTRNSRFYSEPVYIEGVLFNGETLYKIFDSQRKLWRLGAYTSENAAFSYVNKLNVQNQFGLV